MAGDVPVKKLTKTDSTPVPDARCIEEIFLLKSTAQHLKPPSLIQDFLDKYSIPSVLKTNTLNDAIYVKQFTIFSPEYFFYISASLTYKFLITLFVLFYICLWSYHYARGLSYQNSALNKFEPSHNFSCDTIWHGILRIFIILFSIQQKVKAYITFEFYMLKERKKNIIDFLL